MNYMNDLACVCSVKMFILGWSLFRECWWSFSIYQRHCSVL